MCISQPLSYRESVSHKINNVYVNLKSTTPFINVTSILISLESLLSLNKERNFSCSSNGLWFSTLLFPLRKSNYFFIKLSLNNPRFYKICRYDFFALVIL